MCCCYETKTKHCELIRKNPNEVHTINTIYLSKVIHIHFLCFNRQFLYISYMMPSNKHLIMIWLASTREYFIHSIHIVLSIKPKKYQMFSVSFKYWHEKFARALTNSWYVHDMFNCTINVVFIWYPELQCMVTM